MAKGIESMAPAGGQAGHNDFFLVPFLKSKEPRPVGGALKPKIQNRDPEPSSG